MQSTVWLLNYLRMVVKGFITFELPSRLGLISSSSQCSIRRSKILAMAGGSSTRAKKPLKQNSQCPPTSLYQVVLRVPTGAEFNVIPGLTTIVRHALCSAVRRQSNTGHLIVSSRRQRPGYVVQQKEVTDCSPLCTRRGIDPSSGYYWTP